MCVYMYLYIDAYKYVTVYNMHTGVYKYVHVYNMNTDVYKYVHIYIYII